jgi:hypothetical protein
MGLIGGDKIPWAYYRWEIAREFGWTLDYVDALTLGNLQEYFQVRDGIAKARGSLLNKPPQRKQ